MGNQIYAPFAVAVTTDGTSAEVYIDLKNMPVGLSTPTGMFAPNAELLSPSGVSYCNIGGLTTVSQTISGHMVKVVFSAIIGPGTWLLNGTLLYG